ncbi:MAG: hypothetical protein LLF86_04480 [Nitrospiraceae bacterium]|nr:hypothetical protein [Nitrospiraceae bacterium]
MSNKITWVMSLLLIIMCFALTAFADTFVTTILLPSESQAFSSPVQVKIAVDTGKPVPPAMIIFQSHYELQYNSNGQWMPYTEGSGSAKLLPANTGRTKYEANAVLPKELFRAHFGLWRIRAKSDAVQSTDSVPWSEWREFKVTEAAAVDTNRPLNNLLKERRLRGGSVVKPNAPQPLPPAPDLGPQQPAK